MSLLKEPLPKKVQIGIQDGYCNLRCPMCFLHSSDRKINTHNLKGKMPLEDMCRILDEIEINSTISPYRWSEPLMIKNFFQYITAIKNRGLSIVINTNGLLLTKELARFMVDIKFDSVTFSIDAITDETFKKIRGVKVLDKVKKSVFLMLEERGYSTLPRVGVSFALGRGNEHEMRDFISHWLKYVDVVRVNKMHDFEKKIEGISNLEKRSPCYLLYDSLTVDYKGDATICCLDALGQTNMGNVLKDGVRKVWHGEKFSEVRYWHESGQYHKIPFCECCPNWMNHEFGKFVRESIMVRESPIMTFYNRIDKLGNWNHE